MEGGNRRSASVESRARCETKPRLHRQRRYARLRLRSVRRNTAVAKPEIARRELSWIPPGGRARRLCDGDRDADPVPGFVRACSDGYGQKRVRRLRKLEAQQGGERATARGQLQEDGRARQLRSAVGPHPQASDIRTRLSDVLRSGPRHGPAQVRHAHRLRREHEWHRRATAGRARRQSRGQVPGIATKSLRALFAFLERGLSRHGDRAHHPDHGSIAHVRLARQPSAGSRRAMSACRCGPRAHQRAPGQRQRDGSRHAARLRRAVLSGCARAAAGRGGRPLGDAPAQPDSPLGQGVARPRHGGLWRGLGH